MALKLIFKFKTLQENKMQTKIKLQKIFDMNAITTSHMYQPARNSVKVLFPTEKDIEKVMENEAVFKAEDFEPKMSLSLKSCRTIFCTNFDAALLQTYTKENIKEILIQQKWKVKDIYIMKCSKSFKIEMATRKQAHKFLKQEKINIGGICLSENSIEPEIDPTINICWECGIHEPNHNSENCPGRKICIKCGETGHKFYECRMPRKTSEMTEQDMEARYCASCKTRTNHTTLDHRACPIKRNIIRERASIEREKRLSINKESSRDIELIRKALNFTSDEDWPLPHTDSRKAQHNKIATIVTLALLDEASTPGIFENKINEACKNNGLQEIKYKLEPNTAKNFQMTLCGAHLQATENIKTAQKTGVI